MYHIFHQSIRPYYNLIHLHFVILWRLLIIGEGDGRRGGCGDGRGCGVGRGCELIRNIRDSVLASSGRINAFRDEATRQTFEEVMNLTEQVGATVAESVVGSRLVDRMIEGVAGEGEGGRRGEDERGEREQAAAGGSSTGRRRLTSASNVGAMLGEAFDKHVIDKLYSK